MDNEFYKKILFSTLGTSVAEFTTIPICTTKTVYQTSDYKGPWVTARDIYRYRGIKGFYSGTAPAVVSQIVSCSSKFTFYHIFKTYRTTKDNDILNNSLNGMMGGVVGSVFAHPFDVIKNYKQRHEPIVPDIRKVGPGLFYRGYSQNFLKNVVLYSMLFPLYDFFKSQEFSPVQASVSTSITTTLVLQPVDFLKVRMIANKPVLLGWDPRIYYRGFTLNLARVVPHFAIAMTTIEWLTNRYKNLAI